MFEANVRVYGVRKVWRQLQREGFDAARCTVARLMRAMGLEGIIRGKPIRTTVSDKAALPCPLDHVNRQFHAPAPNMLWVSDFTYVATWTGFVLCRLCHPRHPMPAGSSAGGAGEPDGACQLRPGRSWNRLSMTGGPCRKQARAPQR